MNYHLDTTAVADYNSHRLYELYENWCLNRNIKPSKEGYREWIKENYG